jgi:hypothetical protein
LGSFGAVQLQKKGFKQQATNTTGFNANQQVGSTKLDWIGLNFFLFYFLVAKKHLSDDLQSMIAETVQSWLEMK